MPNADAPLTLPSLLNSDETPQRLPSLLTSDENSQRLPCLLPKSALRERLMPKMSPAAFTNWIRLRSTESDDPFPAPVRLGAARSLAWLEPEVAGWLARRQRGGVFSGTRRVAKGAR